jgi:hypothetical protein
MSAKAFSALGKTVVPGQAATIELLDDGGAILAAPPLVCSQQRCRAYSSAG